MPLRERLLRAFREAGFRTQAEAAAAIGVHPVTFSEWLSGRRRPREKYWPVIERVFGRPRAWYYGGAEGGERPPPLSALRRIHEELVRLAKLAGDVLEEPCAGESEEGVVVEDAGELASGLHELIADEALCARLGIDEAAIAWLRGIAAPHAVLSKETYLRAWIDKLESEAHSKAD